MKMKNVLCFISHIVFGCIYSYMSLWNFGVGLMLFTSNVWEFTLIDAILLPMCLLLVLTPAFCIVSIIQSVKYRLKELYKKSFFIQFLPIGTSFLALIFMIISMIMDNH